MEEELYKVDVIERFCNRLRDEEFTKKSEDRDYELLSLLRDINKVIKEHNDFYNIEISNCDLCKYLK